MEQKNSNHLYKVVKRRRRMKLLEKVILGMACIVTFCTTYALILPAIAMSQDVHCGIEEHVHTDECYSDVLTCQVHKHNEQCYTSEWGLICDAAEHQHSDFCYDTYRECVCGQEESFGHTHTADCYEYDYELVCGMSEGGHVHTDDCYWIEMVPVDDGFGGTTYEENWVLACGMTEGQGHVHTDSCYWETARLVCGQEESDGHFHTDDCYIEHNTLVCDAANHVHTDACYGYKKRLVCDKYEDPNHTHTSSCYDGMTVCGLEEHTHEDICYSDIYADLETQAKWEESLPKKLTENWVEDVLEIAKSQVDYHESVNNFDVVDGERKGYTRYGAWYGIPYGDWDSMFVSFCMYYANVADVQYDDNAQRLLEKFDKDKMYEWAEWHTPEPGDLIFFDDNEDLFAERVGIVLMLDTEKELLWTIEGNSEDKVREVKYNPNDKAILGYGIIPENPEYVPQEEFQTEETPEEEVPEAFDEGFVEESDEGFVAEFDENAPEEDTPEEVTSNIEEPEVVEPVPVEPEVIAPEEIGAESISEDVIEVESFAEEVIEDSAAETESIVEVESVAEVESVVEDIIEIEDIESIAEEVDSIVEEVEEVPDRFEKVYYGSDYVVTAYYRAEAEIPEEAEFTALEYLKNSEHYISRYQEAAKLNGWDEQTNYTETFRLFNIGFYVEGVEIEPKDEVEIRITYKTPEVSEESVEGTVESGFDESEKSYRVIHYAEEAEAVEAGLRSESGDQVIEFKVGSLSDFAVYSEESGIMATALPETPDGDLLLELTFDNGSGTANNQSAIVNAYTDNSSVHYYQLSRDHVAPLQNSNDNLEASLYLRPNEKVFMTVESNTERGRNLLGGYDVLTFDFWMWQTGNTGTNGWPIIAAQDAQNIQYGNESYVGFPAQQGWINAERLQGGQGRNNTANVSYYNNTNQWVHVRAEFNDLTGKVTIQLHNQWGTQIAYQQVDNPYKNSQIFKDGSSLQIGKANWNDGSGNYEYFEGYLDEIKIYGYKQEDTKHPQAAKTQWLEVSGVFLYNMDVSDGEPARALGSIEYTVYDSNGNIYGVYTTEKGSFFLNLGNFPPGTYTVAQTKVPDDYEIFPQTRTFVVPDGDHKICVGYFYDYKKTDYKATKTAEVANYKDRIYKVNIDAETAWFSGVVQPGNYNLVLDQSNSMLFPARLVSTGGQVAIVNRGSADTTWNYSKNSESMDAYLRNHNLPTNQLYYIIAQEDTKATVYALWKNSDGHWYYQDASYYAIAQTTGVSNGSAVYYADDTAHGGGYKNSNGRGWVNGGACLDNYFGGDLGADYTSAPQTRNYTIYTGSEMNRLTYLIQSVKETTYMLDRMGIENDVTISTFNSQVNGCITRTVGKNDRAVEDLVDFIDDIDTAGGTAQEYGLQHVIGEHGGANTANHTKNHLSTTKKNLTILITDGALNNKSAYKTQYNTDQQAQADLEAAFVTVGKKLRDGFTQNWTYYQSKLATVGLSVKNVTLAQDLLSDKTQRGVASQGLSFLDNEATELSETLAEIIVKESITFESYSQSGKVVDYISDSFYLVDENGVALQVGDRIKRDGTRAGKDETGFGVVGYDKTTDTWYVSWDGVRDAPIQPGSWVTTDLKPCSADYNGLKGQVLLDVNDNMYIKWVDGVDDPLNEWHASLYLKAKEDFIGGNTIDTNKEAVVTFNSIKEKDTADPNKVVEKLPEVTRKLDTPTVNVRLLPMTNAESEETVFLGDTIENLNQKLQNLWSQVVVQKILVNGDDVHNKYNVGDVNANGLENATFTIQYAVGRDLTEAEWDTLFAGGTVKIPYIYDDASSHGRVGEFQIKLTTDGATSSFANHTATVTGEHIEKYTLNVDFVADTIYSGARKPNKNNGSNGPGTEVGGQQAGTTLETGKGKSESDNNHYVNVVDGKITVEKAIGDGLVDQNNDQTFTFNLEVKTVNPNTKEETWETYTDAKGNPITIKVTVPKGQKEAQATLWNVPRGVYRLSEEASTEYRVDEIATILDKTNCYQIKDPEPPAKTIVFEIGKDKDGVDVIEVFDVSSYRKEYSKLREGFPPEKDTYGTAVSYEFARILNEVGDDFLPVIKKWADPLVPADYDNLTTYVALFDGNDLPVKDENGNVRALKLNKANNWYGTFKIQVTKDHPTAASYHYKIYELSEVSETEKTDTSQYTKAVVENATDSQGTVTPTYVWYKQAKQSGIVDIGGSGFSVKVEDGQIADPTATTSDKKAGSTVTNSKTYVLPESGGIGTMPYTFGGLLLISMSLMYGFILRRKRERRVS